jgi:hypothetical protein
MRMTVNEGLFLLPTMLWEIRYSILWYRTRTQSGMIFSFFFYRVLKKSLYAWWLQYRKLQVIFKVSRHLLARLTVFSKTVFIIAHSECIMFKILHFCVFFCTVIVRFRETFWSLSVIPYNFYFFPLFHYLLLWAVFFREFAVKNIHAV